MSILLGILFLWFALSCFALVGFRALGRHNTKAFNERFDPNPPAR